MIGKFTHSCVRVEVAGAVLVIDPGIWSEPAALNGCDAVLVTHEHSDHIDPRQLAGRGLPVFAPAGATIPDVDFTAVSPGETFAAAGVTILAVGGSHAPVYGDVSPCPNVGYIVDDSLYHPGDALHVPASGVHTLLVPMQASWLKTAEAIDFVRAIRPQRCFGIHDGQINERGAATTNAWLARQGSAAYQWLAPGESALLPAPHLVPSPSMRTALARTP
jgi:L-ascorbate metabolism protein UlaG (beta-lactamase superfamily)